MRREIFHSLRQTVKKPLSRHWDSTDRAIFTAVTTPPQQHMARKHRSDRHQYGLFATPLEELISEDNPVRVVDAFVDMPRA